MLTLEEVKSLQPNVSIKYHGKDGYLHYALVRYVGEDGIELATDNFARANPMFKNYGKTWIVEKSSTFEELVDEYLTMKNIEEDI